MENKGMHYISGRVLGSVVLFWLATVCFLGPLVP